jgi:hypothetical protein
VEVEGANLGQEELVKMQITFPSPGFCLGWVCVLTKSSTDYVAVFWDACPQHAVFWDAYGLPAPGCHRAGKQGPESSPRWLVTLETDFPFLDLSFHIF